MKIRANGVDLEVDISGPEKDASGQSRPVVLLVMGLGMQLVAWPQPMLQVLVDAGYRVITFDNRDIGLSQHFDELGRPNVLWQALKFKLGLPIRPPYSLQDMAADALGLLDSLQIEQAHVAGISMGGMIAQRLALLAPGRIRSLTSIMSSSGARGLPQASKAATRALLGRPANSSLEAVVEHSVKLLQTIGSPGFPTDETLLRERITASMQRSLHPQGMVRQMVASVADTARAAALAGMKVPTLVIHGKDDPLVPLACGEDTARRIPGARLVAIDGMGHDLAPGVIKHLLPLMIGHFRAHHG